MSEYGDLAVARAFWRSVPPQLRPLLQGLIVHYIAMMCVDIGTIIISILALTGSTSEDEDPIVIKFPTLSLHVQRLIVAWVSIELPFFYSEGGFFFSSLYHSYNKCRGEEWGRKTTNLCHHVLNVIYYHFFVFSICLISHASGSSHY